MGTDGEVRPGGDAAAPPVEAMRPSQVRRTILEDHRWLRELLADVDAVARRVEAGDLALCGRLGERFHAMRERFLAHLALEERYLLPALREADAWGEERVRRLDEDHAAQRRRLDALLARFGDASASRAGLATSVRGFVADLLADMADEERSALDERVLRDDPVVVDEEPE